MFCLRRALNRLGDIIQGRQSHSRKRLDGHDAIGFVSVAEDVRTLLGDNKSGIILLAGESFSEKGNTHIWSEEGDVHFYAAKAEGTDDQWLTMYLNPANDPAVRFQVVTKTDGEMAAHIEGEYDGWICGRCNVDGVSVVGNRVVGVPMPQSLIDFLNIEVDGVEAESKSLGQIREKLDGMNDERYDAEYETPMTPRSVMLADLQRVIDKHGKDESVGQILADHEGVEA